MSVVRRFAHVAIDHLSRLSQRVLACLSKHGVEGYIIHKNITVIRQSGCDPDRIFKAVFFVDLYTLSHQSAVSVSVKSVRCAHFIVPFRVFHVSDAASLLSILT